MRIGKVVGNVVSTIKDSGFEGHKLMIVAYEDGSTEIAFDVLDAGVGDTVLVSVDGGASTIIVGDDEAIVDVAICGVVDHYTVDGRTT